MTLAEGAELAVVKEMLRNTLYILHSHETQGTPLIISPLSPHEHVCTKYIAGADLGTNKCNHDIISANQTALDYHLVLPHAF